MSFLSIKNPQKTKQTKNVWTKKTPLPINNLCPHSKIPVETQNEPQLHPKPTALFHGVVSKTREKK